VWRELKDKNNMYLFFPEFNIYSVPLLVAMLVGIATAILLLLRYRSERRITDLLLSFLALLGAYSLICYAIGFMGWYDTYRNTKINYFLLNTDLLLGPLVYWYVRFTTDSSLVWRHAMWWHFLPFGLLVLYDIFVFTYDAQQPGFWEVQNGPWEEQINFKYVYPALTIVNNFSLLLYYAFTIQHFVRYRAGLNHFFSNTIKIELNWLRNFLILVVFLFVSDWIFIYINHNIVPLSWTQNWWSHFLDGCVLLYLCFEAYRAGTLRTRGIQAVGEAASETVVSGEVPDQRTLLLKNQLLEVMQSTRPYLDPELTLPDLAEKIGLPTLQVSQVINQQLGKNFNDFINAYRVEAVKSMLAEGKQAQLSLLGIAYECGFNSKATFNRAFKKHTGVAPGEWIPVSN
jgi:AraC-like DNA-binding protein